LKKLKKMPKKNKLNSNNPKYNKKIEKKKYNKILYKEIKGCKIYMLHEIL
tara:strand:+ start:368 stop:517 length:150 start_codon:yes stop_codon:yes gene_type:complete